MNFHRKATVLLTCWVVALTMSHAQGKNDTKAANKFREQGEQALKAVTQVREQLDKTLEAYEAVLNAKDAKLQPAHKKLTGEIDKTEKLVQSGKKDVQAFREGAESFFTMWEGNLDAIQTESIRKASQSRLEAARTKAKNMAENLSSAKEFYEPLMASLKEQATLLGQDMSNETVALMRDGAASDVRSNGKQVLESLDRVLNDEAADHAEVTEIVEQEEAESGEETLEEP